MELKGLFSLIGLSLLMGTIGTILYYVSLINIILSLGILLTAICVFVIICKKEHESQKKK